VKAEHLLGDKANPRFVVTSVDAMAPGGIYETLYCPRGQAENAIKDTLRLLLLKVAALVTQSVRRVTLQLPAAFPMADVFAAVARAIGATLPCAA
jgi:hypothetical protein